MISIIFVILGGFFNACMDAFENAPNFHESIFRNWNERFWLKSVSWQWAKRIGSWKVDSWHISKTLMVTSLILSIVLYRPIVSLLFDFLLLGVVWNAIFILVYHKLFKIK